MIKTGIAGIYVDFNGKVILVRTGLAVGLIGISSSFGAPASAYEEAFEKGCNYFPFRLFFPQSFHRI
jgi:hypothetical protein